ncbi:hypothetical protein TVAG_452410 [Trichomonas vaginalis G3]|uniref:Secretory carrier membrane protein n=1 Tax=Trichomonas vaginalis (strain ATCC PRA-98 / G3) TaxID=412133 RepID=A2DJW3_TRIV3|nr:secretory carrier-associated membrane protein scamp family [Trichomonas vaginalis G3]EAY19327.1 hypothetical protein TVAG_452410 [Trichomonas vaginalis G3]KAI5527227.1 secretory carrier-associated membrane protein scamp family [Trichomonas vaginalis G3]|eukprot:XP_001580313.1 hypothetical protein [Trichomonas vaginalis G3]
MDEQLPNPFDPSSYKIDDEILVGMTHELEKQPEENKPNFPSFWPLVYHNINTEIQQGFSFLVRMTYFTAVSITYCFFWTLLGSIFNFQIKDNKSSLGQDIIMSLSYCVIFPAALFYIQYYPLYVNLRDGKSIGGCILAQLFVVFFAGVTFTGFRGTGFIGIQYTLSAFANGSLINRIVGVVITVWEIFNFILEIIILIHMNEIEDSQGSLKKHNQEFEP